LEEQNEKESKKEPDSAGKMRQKGKNDKESLTEEKIIRG